MCHGKIWVSSSTFFQKRERKQNQGKEVKSSMGWFACTADAREVDNEVEDDVDEELSEGLEAKPRCAKKVEAAWAGLLSAVADHCRSSLTICSGRN